VSDFSAIAPRILPPHHTSRRLPSPRGPLRRFGPLCTDVTAAHPLQHGLIFSRGNRAIPPRRLTFFPSRANRRLLQGRHQPLRARQPRRSRGLRRHGHQRACPTPDFRCHGGFEPLWCPTEGFQPETGQAEAPVSGFRKRPKSRPVFTFLLLPPALTDSSALSLPPHS
jgi:hypothetical protein